MTADSSNTWLGRVGVTDPWIVVGPKSFDIECFARNNARENQSAGLHIVTEIFHFGSIYYWSCIYRNIEMYLFSYLFTFFIFLFSMYMCNTETKVIFLNPSQFLHVQIYRQWYKIGKKPLNLIYWKLRSHNLICIHVIFILTFLIDYTKYAHNIM